MRVWCGRVLVPIMVALSLGVGTVGVPAAGQPAATLVYVRSADANYLDPGFTTITEDLDVGVNIW